MPVVRKSEGPRSRRREFRRRRRCTVADPIEVTTLRERRAARNLSTIALVMATSDRNPIIEVHDLEAMVVAMIAAVHHDHTAAATPDQEDMVARPVLTGNRAEKMAPSATGSRAAALDRSVGIVVRTRVVTAKVQALRDHTIRVVRDQITMLQDRTTLADRALPTARRTARTLVAARTTVSVHQFSTTATRRATPRGAARRSGTTNR